MNRCLLMAYIDDANALVDAPVVEGHDMATRKREEYFDSSVLQSAGSELSAMCGHGKFLFSFGDRRIRG
jgi:3-dehydroquinate dehydratase